MSNSLLYTTVSNKTTICCAQCSSQFQVTLKNANRKFCSQSCAATFNNIKRGPRPQTVKQKIQNTVQSKIPPYSKVSWCKYCNQQIPNKWYSVCESCKRPNKKSKTQSVISNQNLYPKRNHATIKYAALVLSKCEQSITHADVKQFTDIMHDMIWQHNLSPAQIAIHYNIKHTNFGMYITKCLKIPLRDIKTAGKNTAIQKGTARTDAKDLYYAECEFKFSQQEVVRIPGFELIKDIGIYHPIKNPNGAVRDHILSRAEAYQKGYDPAHIRHPANCRFITNEENNKKNSSSDITYEQLLERISLWEQNVVPELSAERRKVDMTPEHIENIRKSIVQRYSDIRAGKITSKMGQKGTGGRPETFSKKHDWEQINIMIDQGHTLTHIGNSLNIPRYELSKARQKGLIRA